MKLAVTLAALVMAALVLPFVLPRGDAPADQGYLPWRVEVLGNGRSRVFGLSAMRICVPTPRAPEA